MWYLPFSLAPAGLIRSLLVLCGVFVPFTYECTVPSEFDGKTHDGLTGSASLDFSDGTDITWPVSMHGENFSWKCSSSDSNVLFLRSKNIVTFFGGSKYFYACIKYTMFSSTKIYYYLLNEQNPESPVNARIYESSDGSLTACDVCDFSASSSSDFFVMSSDGVTDKSQITGATLGTDPCVTTTTTSTTTMTTEITSQSTAQSTLPSNATILQLLNGTSLDNEGCCVHNHYIVHTFTTSFLLHFIIETFS